MQKVIDQGADHLARLDEVAYHREQMRDASQILTHLVMPMSLPWTHQVAAYRVISRDIDDLEGIIDCEEEFPGEDRMGELGEVQCCTLPQHHVVSARRSSQDPGIIDFVRFRIPRSMEPAIDPIPGDYSVGYPTEIEGVLSFPEAIQRRKRRRVSMVEERTERFTISICFGGTSSRSTLQPTELSSGEPFVLLAKLPNEISGGRRMDASRALDVAAHLGSYDHRHGLPRLSDSTKRVRTGRTRTIWSSKESLSQRPLHKSLLTGCFIDHGQHRRPSDVKVFIRLNGQLLTIDKKNAKKAFDGSDSDDEWAGAYSNHAIESAFQFADEETINKETQHENLQCSFDSASYLDSIRKRNTVSSQFVKRIREPYFVQVMDKDRLWINIRPPALWSHPCEDGVFQVVCSEAGEINGIQYASSFSAGRSAGQNYPWATAIFLDAMAKQHQACCICWSGSETDDERDIIICTSCQVRVHPRCYSGKKTFDPQWLCDSCRDYQEHANALPASLTSLNVRWARKCSLCDQFGSALILLDSLGSNTFTASWVHVHCRTWECAKAFEEGQCVLCSRTSQYLVRCAATGCSLKFHPMCAVVASHAAASGRAADHTFLAGEIESEEDRDIFLSTQYCQEVATVSFGKKKSKKRSIPIAYCGLHNPRRAPDRYGLLPGAIHFKDAVRLPLHRNPNTRP